MRNPDRHTKTVLWGSLLLAFILCPASLTSQISRISLDLSNMYSEFTRGRARTDIEEQRYDQLYTLDIGGYALHPNFLSFSLRSGLRDESYKTSGLLGNGKVHGRSFDLYNLSVNLFQRSTIPVTLYTSRNSQSNSFAYSSQSGSSTYETVSDVAGVSAAIQGNGYWPHLHLGWNRSSTEGTSPLRPYDRRSNNIQVSMSNADDEQVSSYSVDYRSSNSTYALNKYVSAVDSRSPYIQPPRRDMNLSASVRTTMWEDVAVTSDFMQRSQDQITNRTASVNVRFKSSPGYHHSTSFQQLRNYGFGTSTNTYNVVHVLSMDGNGSQHGRIQGEFTKSKTDFLRGATAYDRLAVGSSWMGSFELSRRNTLASTASISAGQEGYSGLPRTFIYTMTTNVILTSRISDWLQSTLSNDMSFQRYLNFGRAFNNKALLSLRATPGLRTSIVAEASRSDSRFFDQIFLPQLRVTGGSLSVSTSMITSIDVTLAYRKTLYQSTFRDLVTSVDASVLHRGWVKNLSFSASGHFTRSSYPGVEIVKFQAGISYQLFAYSLSGNYVLDRFARYTTKGFYLGIRRQISFDFQ